MDMSKDPAVLLYTSDFLAETCLMKDADVGKYIRLLCLQHQNGHLKRATMELACGGYNEIVFDMFVTDENGLYYNERLEEESNKRRAFAESRRRNLQGKRAAQEAEAERVQKPEAEKVQTPEAERVQKPKTETVQTPEAERVQEPGAERMQSAFYGKENQGGSADEKLPYGEYENVYLTRGELESLKIKFPFDYLDKIDDLSYYIKAKGDKYKSHYFTILNWDRNRSLQGGKNVHQQLPSTFDTDDFFQAALERSNRETREALARRRSKDSGST